MTKHALAALALAALCAPAFALDIPLNNGSFDATGGTSPATGTFGFFTSWTTQVGNPGPGNYSGAFGTGATYAGFNPTDGARYAVISNQGLSFVSLQQAVPVALLNMPFFCFDFVYLTTDPTGTALSAQDTFKVVVDYYSDSAGLNQIATQSVTVNPGDLYSIGSFGQAPFGSNNINASRSNSPGPWIGMTIALALPSAPFANFTFYLDNNGTSTSGPGISAILLDHTRINPEPGTMALFGLGAAGLAGLVWRRRMARIAVVAK